MKQFKKILAVALAVVLALALAVPAFAVEDETNSGGNITVTTDSNGKTSITVDGITVDVPQTKPEEKTFENLNDHTYVAYQIFSAKNPKAGNAIEKDRLIDIQWGTGIDSTNFLAALKADKQIGALFTNAGTAEDVAAIVAGWLDIDDAIGTNARAFAAVADEYISGDGVKYDENLEVGYYLIVDSTPTQGGANAVKNLSTLVVNHTEGPFLPDVKVDFPELEKQVLEVDDSLDSSVWRKYADFDTLDNVPFLLTGTLPSDYASYDAYYYCFKDTMQGGLVLNRDSIKVLVNGRQETTGYDVVYSGSQHFEVVFHDLKQLTKDAGSVIQVVYTARLGSDGLVLGAGGNENAAKLVFSNDPNYRGSGTPGGTPTPVPTPGGEPTPTPTPPPTGETPEKTAVVFTFELDASKVKEDGTALSGAAFALYKEYADKDALPDSLKDAEKEEITVKSAVDGTAQTRTFYQVSTIKTGAGTGNNLYAFTGLDEGYYMLRETVVPNGYNKAEDMFFTVAATFAPQAAGSEKMKVETLTVDSIKDVNGNPILNMAKGDDNGKALSITGTPADGKLPIDIVNLTGVLLPSTGGIGTTIFYVIGGLLALAAVVLLITKKRMGNQDKPE